MKKTQQKTFHCQNCGVAYPKWQGKCNTCYEWNTIVEELVSAHAMNSRSMAGIVLPPNQPRPLHEVAEQAHHRVPCPDQELSRVLGGGIVPGSLVLLGGEPGIGKSTLLLQLALTLSSQKVLYVSGEENEAQIKLRADRMEYASDHCYVLNETSLENIFQQLKQHKPALLIIDSIQTLHTERIESASGSVAQVRECAAALLRYAKTTQTPVFLIGHITKEGHLAGPKVLEHMVDTVLQFEGDRHLSYRIVRSIKNRFGPTSELGIYEMQQDGLREVSNPSELLIFQRSHPLSGIAIGASLEGSRALLIEIQALVGPATFGTAQRSTTGFDTKRLNMLLAVLERRVGLRLSTQDVFLNIAGGLSVNDPALDLAICASIASSFKDHVIPQDCCFAAEVGLGGEVRGVSRIEQRIAEAAKLGFKKIFIAQQNLKGIAAQKNDIHIHAIAKIEEMLHSSP